MRAGVSQLGREPIPFGHEMVEPPVIMRHARAKAATNQESQLRLPSGESAPKRIASTASATNTNTLV